MVLNSIWLQLISDLFVNLSAGWFGAALIVPTTSKRSGPINLTILTIDVIAGILFMILAYQFQQLRS